MTAPDASIELMRLVTGAWAARLVHTVVELGIADHLAGTPRGVDFLAGQIGANAPRGPHRTTAIRIEPIKPFGGLASADLHRPRLGVLVQL